MKVELYGIEISNPQKLIFPKDNITKLDVAKYYQKVAQKMLPFLENRLLSAIRCHEGIDGECFFKKHPNTESDMVSTFIDEGDVYFYVKDKMGVVQQVQLGTLEFHTWGSKIESINTPDLMVFDLDPSEDVTLKQLREGVLCLKDVLDKLQLESYLKTSGGKGYHVVVPFSESKNWERFSDFSKQIALLLEAQFPKMFTSNIRKADRKGRIFVDYLRNTKGATCVAPYSLRARDGASLSFPIFWKDLNDVSPNGVNLQNIDNFLTRENPWKNLYKTKQILK